MSLINRMLKDLDQRKASPQGNPTLAGVVRTVEPAERSIGLMAGLGVTVLLVLGAGYFAWVEWLAPAQVSQPVETKLPEARKLPAPPAASAAPAPAPAALSTPVAETSGSRLPGLDMELRTLSASVPKKKTAPAADPAPAVVAPVAGTVKPVSEDKPKEARPAKSARVSRDAALKSVTPQQKSDNLYKQAVAMLQQGRVAEARSTLWQALDETPSNHNARQLLVGLLVESKRNGDAAVLLQDGIKLAPEQTGFVMALARLQVEAGNRQISLQTLEQGLKYAADDADYHGFYAALLQREERHEEAVANYLAALRQDPANISWLVGVGISLQAQGKYADAREAFDRARQLDQLSPELATFVDQRLSQLKGK
ncbi:MAG TPA: tetratricopeptide repeat protein [Novimethylophilus sp.]|jgi:MSHA biogenesis protein MshN|uniref:tetratricopeptide repeat protein n=1 Tax=Novimethylophilus sp. TaxID=2137426 RepID=UPI002F3F390D